jgi:hypothetical protein
LPCVPASRKLDAAGVASLSCRKLWLHGARNLCPRSKQAADEWKQPFQKEYTESTVTQAFEKLMGLRQDVELALEKAGLKSTTPAEKKRPGLMLSPTR